MRAPTIEHGGRDAAMEDTTPTEGERRLAENTTGLTDQPLAPPIARMSLHTHEADTATQDIFRTPRDADSTPSSTAIPPNTTTATGEAAKRLQPHHRVDNDTWQKLFKVEKSAPSLVSPDAALKRLSSFFELKKVPCTDSQYAATQRIIQQVYKKSVHTKDDKGSTKFKAVSGLSLYRQVDAKISMAVSNFYSGKPWEMDMPHPAEYLALQMISSTASLPSLVPPNLNLLGRVLDLDYPKGDTVTRSSVKEMIDELEKKLPIMMKAFTDESERKFTQKTKENMIAAKKDVERFAAAVQTVNKAQDTDLESLKKEMGRMAAKHDALAKKHEQVVKQLASLEKELKEVKDSRVITPRPLGLPAKRKRGDMTVTSTPTPRKLRSGGRTFRPVQAPDNDGEDDRDDAEDNGADDDGDWLDKIR